MKIENRGLLRWLALGVSTSISLLAAPGCTSATGDEATPERTGEAEAAICTTCVPPGCGQCMPNGTELCWRATGVKYTKSCAYVAAAPVPPATPPGSARCNHDLVRLTNQADGILQTPRVVNVYWGSYWNSGEGAGLRAQYEATWSDLANAPSFWNRLSEYGVHNGSYWGSVVTNTSLGPGSLNSCTTASNCNTGEVCSNGVCEIHFPDANFSTFLDAEMTAGQIPTPDGNTVYVVYLPRGVRSADNANSGSVVAYHHDYVGQYGQTFFAEIDNRRTDAVGTTIAATHEIDEAATDAKLRDGFVEVSTDSEVGDLCNWVPTTIMGHVTNAVWSQAACRCVGKRDDESLDFDGDWKSDLAVFRAVETEWFELDSATNSVGSANFGLAGDLLVPGDYDGDGKADVATWRPSDVLWRSLLSGSGTTRVDGWGLNTDQKVPRDYDGDGVTDLAIWTPATGGWAVHGSWQNKMWSQTWGTEGDIPVPADYDGDGKADFAVWRPSNGTWYVVSSSTGVGTSTQWGASGDRPVPGDYDGDGKTDFAVWRPSNVLWYVMHTIDSGSTVQGWGLNTDVLVPRDFDGDGKTDFGIFTPSTGTFAYQPSRTTAGVSIAFGFRTDQIP
jgi:hypothetical protein